MAMDPSVKQAANSSMMGLMASDPSSKAPAPSEPDGDEDDGGQVTCPACGAGFSVQKQTNYVAGPVTTPPSGGSGGPSAGGPPPSMGGAPGGM